MFPPNEPDAHVERAPALVALLRRRRSEVVETWERCVRATERGRDVPRLALLDDIPPLIDAIADLLDAGAGREASSEAAEQLARCHGEARLAHGFDLEEVAAEYSALRSCVIGLWGEEVGKLDPREVQLFDAAIDQAVATAVRRYVDARTRTLEALDRFSAVALRADDLEGLIQELLEILVDTMPVVDTATILLVEGDRLRVMANALFDGMDERERTLAIGEGFAGSIAEHRSPRELTGTEIDDVVVSPILRSQRLETLYGVPLIVEGEVIGVAHMGSRSAATFSDEDRTLFSAMAERAGNVLHQRRLREEAERLTEVLAAGDPCFIMDASWHIRFINERQERIFQTSAAKSIGRPFWEVWPDAAQPDSRYWTEYHRAMRERVPVEFEEYYAPLDIWTHVTAYPTADGGLAAFIRDVNERKRLEEARERFIAVLGHDLRTPLGAISMSAQALLARRDLDPTMHRGLTRIRAASQRMARIISDVLDWAKIRLGEGLNLSSERVDLGSLCERVVTEISTAHPDRDLRLERHGACVGSWDPGLIAQMLTNLVGNAIQHGDPDAPVQVTTRDLGGSVTLEVHNQGPPIPCDRIGHLFEPFEREPKDQLAKQSLGLGLYIVGRIVDAHEGRIEVDSTAEAGTTFRVHLPKAPHGSG